MRILHIYELGPLGEGRAYSGVDVAILELCRHLAKLGHEVSIVTGAGADGGLEDRYAGDVRIIPVDFLGTMRRTWSPSSLSLTRQLLFPLALRDVRGYDIYHGHIYTSGLLACYLAGKNNAAAVNTIHGSYYPVWREIAPLPAAMFYSAGERLLAPLLAGKADLQIHTSSYFARQVVAWGASKDKVRVIPNGVDREAFNLRRSKEKTRSGVLFTARRLVRKNGLEHLIRAVSLLNGRDCRLLIAGDGPEKRKLQALACSLGLRDRVTFLGLLSHGEVAGYLCRAEIAVVPSLIEATSLFMLEAMAMGKGVIATRCGGLEEVINGRNGILVEPRDERALAGAVVELLEDRGMLRRMGRAAKRTAEAYSWSRVAEKTEAEYKRVTPTLT